MRCIIRLALFGFLKELRESRLSICIFSLAVQAQRRSTLAALMASTPIVTLAALQLTMVESSEKLIESIDICWICRPHAVVRYVVSDELLGEGTRPLDSVIDVAGVHP